MLNELRNISVIFLKIGDLDYDSPTFLPMAQQALAIGLKALEQFEGSLRQMMMDDKGLTILAVFGLPPWSHENEASFALKAALQMNQKMKEAGFTHFSFGVASGVVFTGKVGSELRCDHTVLGDCVNMAARLMCSKLATNGILCDEATYVATRNLFQFFTPDPILVKGKSVPINVYKPESERALDVNTTLAAFDPNMEKTLIGRQAERELMKSLVERLVSGPINAPSSTVVIEGESGQGKTRMGRFLANTALGAGLLVTYAFFFFFLFFLLFFFSKRVAIERGRQEDASAHDPPCRDGPCGHNKWRRLPVQPRVVPPAPGQPPVCPQTPRVEREHGLD